LVLLPRVDVNVADNTAPTVIAKIANPTNTSINVIPD